LKARNARKNSEKKVSGNLFGTDFTDFTDDSVCSGIRVSESPLRVITPLRATKGTAKTLSLAESAGNAEDQTRTEVQVVRTESKGNPVCLRLV